MFHSEFAGDVSPRTWHGLAHAESVPQLQLLFFSLVPMGYDYSYS